MSSEPSDTPGNTSLHFEYSQLDPVQPAAQWHLAREVAPGPASQCLLAEGNPVPQYVQIAAPLIEKYCVMQGTHVADDTALVAELIVPGMNEIG